MHLLAVHHSNRLALLLVVSIVAHVVLLQKLCVFLPQDLSLLLKTVGPETQKTHLAPSSTVRHHQNPNKCTATTHVCEKHRFAVKERVHSLGPLFGFIVDFGDDAVFLVHEVIVNFLQSPETAGRGKHPS